jgi:hypothetical protein
MFPDFLKKLLKAKKFYFLLFLSYLVTIIMVGYIQSGLLLKYNAASPALDDEPEETARVYSSSSMINGVTVQYYHSLSKEKPNCLLIYLRDHIRPVGNIQPIRKLFQDSQCDFIDLREFNKETHFTYGYNESVTFQQFITTLLEELNFSIDQVTLIAEGASATTAVLFSIRNPNLYSAIFLDAIFKLEDFLHYRLIQNRIVGLPGITPIAVLLTKLRAGFIGSELSFSKLLRKVKTPVLLICSVDNYKTGNECFRLKAEMLDEEDKNLTVHQILSSSSRGPLEVRKDQQAIVFQYLAEEGLILKTIK